MKSFLLLTTLALFLIYEVNSQCGQLINGRSDKSQCTSQGGQCITFLGKNTDDCIPTWGCKFSQALGSCVDTQGLCSQKNGCCQIVGQDKYTGIPICRCNFAISTSNCPNCTLTKIFNGLDIVSKTPIGQIGGFQCIDSNNQCTSQKKCCQLKKFTYQSSSWNVCSCDNSNCPSCRYNRSKAACIDQNGFCEKQGLCCQAQDGQFDPFTRQPICKCVQKKFCPKCQKCTSNCKSSCYDPSNVCNQNNGLCCQMQIQNGYELCVCNNCPQNQCNYNSASKSCQGKCINSTDCCKFTGEYEKTFYPPYVGNPICKCQPIGFIPICSDCKYNTSIGRCQDVTGKCKQILGGCCQLDTYKSICLCKDCPPTPTKCYLDPKSQLCINQGCQTCCTKKTDTNNKSFCQCTPPCQNSTTQAKCVYNPSSNNCQNISCQGCCRKVVDCLGVHCQCKSCGGISPVLDTINLNTNN